MRIRPFDRARRLRQDGPVGRSAAAADGPAAAVENRILTPVRRVSSTRSLCAR